MLITKHPEKICKCDDPDKKLEIKPKIKKGVILLFFSFISVNSPR